MTMKKILPPKKKVSQSKSEPYVSEHRPSLSFYEDQLPELKNMAINDKITLCVEVQLESLGKEDYGDYKGQIRATFKVNKVGVDNDADKDDKS